MSHKKGHISKVCRSKDTVNKEKTQKLKAKKKNRVHLMETKEESTSGETTTDSELGLHLVSQKGHLSLICVKPKVEGKIIKMELDTGFVS